MSRKKKNVMTKHKKLEFSYPKYASDNVRAYQRREIDPILSRLFEKNMAENPSMSDPDRYDEYVNEAVTRYILIRNVCTLECYFRKIASMIVDNNGTDFSKFFKRYQDFETKFNEVNKDIGLSGKRKKLTRGQFFADQFNFSNADEIDWVFSRLLGVRFFDTVKRINKYPLSNPYPGSIGFVRNWKKFKKMFEWRNRTVHSMERVQLSREELRSLCSNTLMFMEQSSVLLEPPTSLGGNSEQDYFYQVINQEKKRYSEEQKRTGNPSKRKRTVSTNVDDLVILP
jgi:hypothetical protein